MQKFLALLLSLAIAGCSFGKGGMPAPETVLVPGGDFVMGSGIAEREAASYESVYISSEAVD